VIVILIAARASVRITSNIIISITISKCKTNSLPL